MPVSVFETWGAPVRTLRPFIVFFFVVSLVAAGCAGGTRKVTSPASALLGHWKNTVPGNKTEIYYSPDTATFKSGGETISRPYKVVSENPSTFSLDIEYTSNLKGAGPSTLGFSSDRNTLLVYPERVPELLKYTYIDSKQNP